MLAQFNTNVLKNCNNFVITYFVEMKTPVIKIGNSKGLRLSKEILERYGIKDSVDVILEDGQIVIKPIAEPRSGWKEAFLAAQSHQEELLIPDVFEDEDFEEWS